MTEVLSFAKTGIGFFAHSNWKEEKKIFLSRCYFFVYLCFWDTA